MDTNLNLLDNLRVAAPCPASWSDMRGDNRVRYCDQCSLHVYNLSDMTRAEAESLLESTEGRLCVRYYQRADGTVLTRNCPVGVQRVRLRLRRTLAALAAVIGLIVTSLVFFGGSLFHRQGRLRYIQPFSLVADRLDPPPAKPLRRRVVGLAVRPRPQMTRSIPISYHHH